MINITTFCQAQQKIATVRGTNVNVRDCAELNCNVLFQVSTGDYCNILFNMKDENILGYGINSWYKIDYQGQEGFIYGAFLDFVSDEAKMDVYNTKSTALGVIKGNEVNARVCAGIACSKVFQVNTGDKVEVIGKTTDYYVEGIGEKPWYEIKYNGKKGYVFGHFLECFSCDFQTAPVISSFSTQTGTIIGDRVNVRDCKDVNCQVNFQLDIGEKCKVKGIHQDSSATGIQYPWYEIDYQGKTGFVYGKFLSIQSSLKKPLKIWALIVGVSDYSSQLNINDLRYSAEDAKRMYQFLKSPEGGNLSDNQIKILRDSEATKQNILQHANHLFQQASNDDLIIVYFSGHGGPNYFVAHDQPLKYSDVRDIIEKSPAQKRLCVADACFSGTWSNNGNALATKSVLTDAQLEKMYYEALANSNNGIALFMSSERDETSIEAAQLGQGLFTFCYIEGLKGDADADGNKIVTLQELYEYVKAHVSYAAWNYFQHQQTPKISGKFDVDMPIGVVR